MSSSYDSAVVDTAMIEDPRLLNLSRGTRLLYLEMLVWAKLRRTDGHVPLAALPRLTDEPEPKAAANRLEDGGLLRTDDDIGGFWIVDFGATQMDRAAVDRKVRAAKNARQRYEERHPDRPRRWKGRTDVSPDDSDDESGDATASLPARPPAREGQVGNGAGSGLSDDAAPAPRECIGCGRDFLGPGYGANGVAMCSWRCRDSWKRGSVEGRYLEAIEGGAA